MSSAETRYRLAAISILLLITVLAVTYSEQYAQMFRWLLESSIPLIYDRFDTYQLAIIKNKSEWGYQLLANNTAAITVAQTTLPANLGVTAFTLIAHSIQHILFFNLVLIGSIFIYRLDYRKLLALSPLAIVALELIDIPMVLTGSIEDLLLSQFDPTHHETSIRIIWMNFLTNGGRIGLAMFAAWMIVIGCRLSVKKQTL